MCFYFQYIPVSLYSDLPCLPNVGVTLGFTESDTKIDDLDRHFPFIGSTVMFCTCLYICRYSNPHYLHHIFLADNNIT